MTRRVWSGLHLVAVAWWLQVKMLVFSPFEGFMQAIWPLFFSTTAFLVYRVNGSTADLIYAALGSAAMGLWSAVATTASTTLQRERSNGTLEYLVAAPRSFALILTPITLAMATTGLYSLVSTLIWGWAVFGIPLHVASAGLFGLSVLVTVVAMGMFGFVLSMAAVRYRSAWALGNVLEYPGWILCGFLVPLSVLPSWAAPVSDALAPTWGVRAIRAAAEGASPWPAIGWCAALGIVYGVAGAVAAGRVLQSARRHATLSLS